MFVVATMMVQSGLKIVLVLATSRIQGPWSSCRETTEQKTLPMQHRSRDLKQFMEQCLDQLAQWLQWLRKTQNQRNENLRGSLGLMPLRRTTA